MPKKLNEGHKRVLMTALVRPYTVHINDRLRHGLTKQMAMKACVDLQAQGLLHRVPGLEFVYVITEKGRSLAAKALAKTIVQPRPLSEITAELKEAERNLSPESLHALNMPAEEPAPIPMLLHCPMCNGRHIDPEGFKPHHTHACQHCGHCWRPALVRTVGVQYLPGFKNEEHA